MTAVPIGPRVDELAERIAEDALASEDKAFRLDAFKALSQFFIGLTRASRKADGDEDEPVGRSMLDWRDAAARAAETAKTKRVNGRQK